MLKQLRRKFILITMGVVLAMLAVIFSLIYTMVRTNLENESYSTLQDLTQIATQSGGMSQIPQDVNAPWFILQVNQLGYISAIGYTGYDLNDATFLQELVTWVVQENADTGVLNSYSLMYRMVIGRTGYTIVFLDISGFNASLRALIESCILIGTLSLIAFWIISYFLARWAVRPVEEAWQRQRQFVSDASHELKTPLTVIMSNAELLQGEITEQQEGSRFARNIMTMSYQMKDLVEGLLELARVDNGQVKKTFEPLDMSLLAQEALLPFEPVLFEKGIQLESRIEPGIHLTGSSRYLRQVVDILLDNAGKYSDPGIVEVRLARQGKTCLLTVTNPGQPIAPQEQKKIFQRFYRADQSRSRTGSFGLGLAIAQSVVQEHGGKIWVRSNPTGNCFCVQLPCDTN